MTPMALAVSEIFGPVLQGEGPVAGEPTVFVRLGGCDFRCSWCDSMHAVDPAHRSEWRPMIAEEVMERVSELAPLPARAVAGGLLVTLSGGNPAMQPCGPLVEVGHRLGYRFCIETQGSIAPAWLRIVDIVVLSPKPPSSGMMMNWTRFGRCLAMASPPENPRWYQRVLKVPIFDAGDLDWLERELCRRFPHMPLWLSVGNPWPPGTPAPAGRGMYDHDLSELRGLLLERYRWLGDEVLRRRLPARVLPQMHVLAYGNERQR